MKFKSKSVLAAWIVCAAVASAGTAYADPIAFPGGPIDGSRITEGEIYLGIPQAATALSGCEIAEAYVTAINDQDYPAAAALFAEDAIVLHAAGPAVGRQSIHDFYAGRINRLGVKIVPVAYATGPGVCMVQLAVGRTLEDGRVEYYSASYDQFLVNDAGLASMMIVYGRRSAIAEGTVRSIRAPVQP